MKRYLLLLLTVIYATVSSGIMLNFHYCKGQLVQVQWMEAKEACSRCGQIHTDHSCCSDKAVQVKLSIDQTAQTVAMPTLLPVVTELLSFGASVLPVPPLRNLPDSPAPSADDPPGHGQASLFVRYCTYLI